LKLIELDKSIQEGNGDQYSAKICVLEVFLIDKVRMWGTEHFILAELTL
jgi:hypothetical protein